MRREESPGIPIGKDLPTEDQLAELSRLHDVADDARRAYKRAIDDNETIDRASIKVAGQIKALQVTIDNESIALSVAAGNVEQWSSSISDVRAALNEVTAQLLGNVGAEVPLLLLPVRLETRFEYGAEGDKPQALRIRIFPDDIHVDSHETELSIDEHVWGRTFVAMYQRAASDAERLGAWRILLGRFGARRAAWIASTELKKQGRIVRPEASPSLRAKS